MGAHRTAAIGGGRGQKNMNSNVTVGGWNFIFGKMA
jgi:hypothetical protein